MISMPLQGPWTLKLARGDDPQWLLIQTKSADDPQKLEAANLDGVLLCEAAQLTVQTIIRMQGRLMQKRGWLYASGSFEQDEASPWFRETYALGLAENEQGWRTFAVPSWENTVVFPEGREDPKIREAEANMPVGIFLEKVAAEPQKPVDLVFPEFDPKGHIVPPMWGEAKVQPPIELAIDFGYGAHYAVLALTEIDGRLLVHDEFYETGVVTHDVVMNLMHRPWWKRVTGGVMDVAGRQHQGDRSQFELWYQLTGFHLRSRKVSPMSWIMRMHTFLQDPKEKKPRLLFTTKCKGCVAELQRYKWRIVDGIRVGKEPIPLYNHALSALGYYLIDKYGMVDNMARTPSEKRKNPYAKRHNWGER